MAELDRDSFLSFPESKSKDIFLRKQPEGFNPSDPLKERLCPGVKTFEKL
jgi:hypothetical protein